MSVKLTDRELMEKIVENFNLLQNAYSVMHNDIVLKRNEEINHFKKLVENHVEYVQKMIIPKLTEKFVEILHEKLDKSINKEYISTFIKESMEKFVLQSKYLNNRVRDIQKKLEEVIEERRVNIHVSVDDIERVPIELPLLGKNKKRRRFAVKKVR